jgi:aryl carrier-like protein
MTQNEKNTPVPPTRAELIDQVSSVLGKSSAELSPDTNLLEAGLGSLEMIRLVTLWRRSGLEISFYEIAREPSVSAWERYLTARACR